MTEWTELKDLQAVAKAQADGWEIEAGGSTGTKWRPWVLPDIWYPNWQYRGRPKVERKVVRVREAVIKFEGGGHRVTEMDQYEYDWLNSLGNYEVHWTNDPEWREVEIK